MFKKYNSIGKEELRAAIKVMKSGNLSGYVADKSKNFYGGKYVKSFEDYLKKFYGVRICNNCKFMDFRINVHGWFT